MGKTRQTENTKYISIILLHKLFFVFNIFYWLCIRVVPFFSAFNSLSPCTSPPTIIPHLSSHPGVIHISSLASPFPIVLNLLLSILYLPFMLLIPYTFFPIPPLPLPTNSPPCDPYFCESVPVLLVCLVHFHFCFWVFFFRFSCW